MIFKLLNLCISKNASDLHFKVGYPPFLRIDGSMIAVKEFAPISDEDYENMLEAILDDAQLTTFLNYKKLDLGYSFQNARFRVNLFNDLLGGNAVFRIIPFQRLSFKDINLPRSACQLADKPNGLILVTGATGAGKSTTLSTFITYLNSNYNKTIITVEDPIEYIFEDDLSLISQRQIGVDCNSFEDGIKGALKSDCDVLMIGELRNAKAVEMTLLAAESGKLVFATLHSNTAIQALERFANLFPKSLHSQILGRLSNCLKGIITQTLISKRSGKGRVAAFEILLNIAAVKGLIAENRIHLITSYIESGGITGMQSLDQSIIELVLQNKINKIDALAKAHNKTYVKNRIEKQEGKILNET